jgi:hypothetical protein
MRSVAKVCLVALLALTIAVPGAVAQGKGKGQGKGSGSGAATATGAGSGHSGDHGPGTTPAGYEKGKKTGWGDCDVPPGQAKPANCTDLAKGQGKDKAKNKDTKEKSKENKEKAKDKAEKAKDKAKSKG